MLSQIVREITDKYAGFQPKKGTICNQTDMDTRKVSVVKIVGGSLYSNDRVSNFWSWRTKIKIGWSKKVYSGYGNFTPYIKK